MWCTFTYFYLNSAPLGYSFAQKCVTVDTNGYALYFSVGKDIENKELWQQVVKSNSLLPELFCRICILRSWCGAQQPLGSLAAGNIPRVFLFQW